MILEPKKTIGVKVPESIYRWLDDLAKREKTGKGNIVLKLILQAYRENKLKIYRKDHTPAPGKGLQAEEKTAEDKNFKEKSAEKGPVILDANYFYKVLGHWPHMAKKDVLIKLLKSKGIPEIKAKVLINTIVSEGIYEERNGKLYLRKEAVA